MKIISFSNFKELSTFIFLLSTSTYCEITNARNLIKKEGLFYNKITKKLFTGLVEFQYENGKLRAKGSLKKGNDADLCVFDINKTWVVDKSKLKSKSKNTPIENKKLQGQVLKTIVKGELAYERI